jgi:CheY-like chemotaxis protein
MPLSKVLVVHDDAAVRAELSWHLGEHGAGYQTIEASTSTAGIELAIMAGPDLIVARQDLSPAGGGALCRAVRESERLRFTPLILLLKSGERAARLAGLTDGADACLAEPIDGEELCAQARTLLALRARARDLERRHHELILARDRDVLIEKSAFAGRLAIGLAHELNNPIAALSSNLAYLGEELAAVQSAIAPADDDRFGEFVDNAAAVLGDSRVALARMTETIAALQVFRGREDEVNIPDHEPVALQRIVDEMLVLIGPRRDGVTIEATGDLGCTAPVHGYEIAQAFAHIVGYLAHRGAGKSRVIKLHAARQDPEVVVRIEGLGPDLDAGEAARLFDPGMVVADDRMKLTLDLAASASYIGRNRGTIRVASPRAGVTGFEIRFFGEH